MKFKIKAEPVGELPREYWYTYVYPQGSNEPINNARPSFSSSHKAIEYGKLVAKNYVEEKAARAKQIQASVIVDFEV